MTLEKNEKLSRGRNFGVVLLKAKVLFYALLYSFSFLVAVQRVPNPT
jgi:hypothetical protein